MHKIRSILKKTCTIISILKKCRWILAKLEVNGLEFNRNTCYQQYDDLTTINNVSTKRIYLNKKNTINESKITYASYAFTFQCIRLTLLNFNRPVIGLAQSSVVHSS